MTVMKTYVQLDKAGIVVAVIRTTSQEPKSNRLIEVVGLRAKTIRCGDTWNRLPQAEVMPAED